MSIIEQLQQFRKKNHLPILLQTEAAECGLVCLAMIAHYYGHDVDLPTMRRRFPISPKGSTLSYLITIADRLELISRPLRVELEYLPQLKTPCMIHWNLNHMVVFRGIIDRKFIIHDPALGVVRYSVETFSKYFTGIILELTPAHDFKPIKNRHSISIRSLTGKITGLKRAFVRILLLSLALEIFVLTSPLFIQGVLDQVLISGDQKLLLVLALGFTSILFFQSSTTAIRGWIVAWVGAYVNTQWTTNLFRHLLSLPVDFFYKRHIGDILSRFESIHIIQQTLTTSFIETILDGIMGLTALILLSIYSLSLTAIILTCFGLYLILRTISSKKLRNTQEEQIHQGAFQQTSLVESIRGIHTIKLANAQAERTSLLANFTVKVAHKDVQIQHIKITFNALNQLIFGIGRILIISIGANEVLEHHFSGGMLIAYLSYTEQFSTHGTSLIDRIIDFKLLGLQTQRIADIALTEPERHVSSHALNIDTSDLEIRLENIGFRYSNDEPWILRNCSLLIEPGESIAIIGSSGCGKTTLAKLVLGLLKPQEGKILINKVPILQFGLGAYRQLFGTVMQDDQLFSGSISENISFFSYNPDLAQIENSARQALIHEEIMEMPMAYETLVGDMGSTLSGGQKQRILLARALYHSPKGLILDEATCHLDLVNENQINRIIRPLKITKLVITHRPETLAHVDRILILKNGHLLHYTSNSIPIIDSQPHL